MTEVEFTKRHGIRPHGTVSGHLNRSDVEESSVITSDTSKQAGAPMTHTAENRYLAVRELHRSPEGVPADPPEVAQAHAALRELVGKHRDDNKWSRDTHRAVARLKRIVDGHADQIVEIARTKGLLNIHTKEQ